MSFPISHTFVLPWRLYNFIQHIAWAKYTHINQNNTAEGKYSLTRHF